MALIVREASLFRCFVDPVSMFDGIDSIFIADVVIILISQRMIMDRLLVSLYALVPISSSRNVAVRSGDTVVLLRFVPVSIHPKSLSASSAFDMYSSHQSHQ